MMTRWLLRLAVTGSALLLCAAIVFWVRSYRVRDEVEIYRRPYVAGEQPLLLLLWIRSAAGGIRVDAYQVDEPLLPEEVKKMETRIAEQTDRSRWKSFREPAPVYTALMPREEWTYSGAAGFEWGRRATSH